MKFIRDECSFLFFNDTATTEIYTLSLHDALPIYENDRERHDQQDVNEPTHRVRRHQDRKSTRLNSSHITISYAVFCLKKKHICDGICLQHLGSVSVLCVSKLGIAW